MKHPSDSLARFMHGIFDFHRDKGLPTVAAKAKMYDESLNAFYGLFKQEKDIPDHALVIAAQNMSRLLNARGAKIQKEVDAMLKQGSVTPDDPHIKAMCDIKAAKDAVDEFIKNYNGTAKKEDSHGSR